MYCAPSQIGAIADFLNIKKKFSILLWMVDVYTFQIYCVSFFDWHFFTTNFTDGFLDVTGLAFIVMLKSKMHPHWSAGTLLWNQNYPFLHVIILAIAFYPSHSMLS